jgi:integrase
MRKKHCRNGAGWNKDRSQGVKVHFTAAEIHQISYWLIEQRNWHDYALLSLALDSMLRSVDLLNLRVRDVCYSNGQVRDKISAKQRKTAKPVHPELTGVTRKAVAHWIYASGKRGRAYLFTRTKKGRDAKPITRKHLSSLVKQWAGWLDHPPDDYASHSLRRTKGLLMYQAGERVADIAKAYGHASEASTLAYLGIDQVRVGMMCRKYALTVDFNAGGARRQVSSKGGVRRNATKKPSR